MSGEICELASHFSCWLIDFNSISIKSRIILCLEAKESHSLYFYIFIYILMFLLIFLHTAQENTNIFFFIYTWPWHQHLQLITLQCANYVAQLLLSLVDSSKLYTGVTSYGYTVFISWRNFLKNQAIQLWIDSTNRKKNVKLPWKISCLEKKTNRHSIYLLTCFLMYLK